VTGENRESCIKYFQAPVAPDPVKYNPCPAGSNLLTLKSTATRLDVNLRYLLGVSVAPQSVPSVVHTHAALMLHWHAARASCRT
jgi:hypothetical protein